MTEIHENMKIFKTCFMIEDGLSILHVSSLDQNSLKHLP